MLKKVVTYKDFDGEERTDEFYFNLTKAECTELQLSKEGGLSKLLGKIVSEHNNEKLMEYFKKIVLMSYGERTLDSKGRIIHLKNDRVREEFQSSAAFSEIYMELAFNDEAAAEFVNGILPADLEDSVKNNMKILPGKAPVVVETPQA